MTKTLGIPHIRDREPSALKGARWVREGAGVLALAYFIHFATRSRNKKHVSSTTP